ERTRADAESGEEQSDGRCEANRRRAFGNRLAGSGTTETKQGAGRRTAAIPARLFDLSSRQDSGGTDAITVRSSAFSSGGPGKPLRCGRTNSDRPDRLKAGLQTLRTALTAFQIRAPKNESMKGVKPFCSASRSFKCLRSRIGLGS